MPHCLTCCRISLPHTLKDRTEFAGALVLNTAVVFACVEIVWAFYVMTNSPFWGAMIFQILNTILAGIFTGWISVWVYYHVMRSIQTGFGHTCQKCFRGVEDKDGDGVECCEVIMTMRQAWNEQKDTRAELDPDTKDDLGAPTVPSMHFSTRNSNSRWNPSQTPPPLAGSAASF